MSRYNGDDLLLLDVWVQMRVADLSDDWAHAVYDVIRGEPWVFGPRAFEVNIRVDDAANKQARAERLAHMRGGPIPDAAAALVELLAWVRSDDCGSGSSSVETLPRLPARSHITRYGSGRALSVLEKEILTDDPSRSPLRDARVARHGDAIR